MHFFGIDLQQLIQTAGYVGLFLILFAETGLFIGFFLPGDSLLFVAGLLAYQGLFHPALLMLVIAAGAILGNIAGYAFGYRVGVKLFQRPDSKIFKQQHLRTAESFYEEHGGKTILLARFIPIVRTFAPIVAGVGKMDYKTFLAYNIGGAIGWTVLLVMGGYFLGSLVKDVDKYLLPIVLVIIVLSFLPGVFHYLKEKKRNQAS
jgi:membrane-associated protein